MILLDLEVFVLLRIEVIARDFHGSVLRIDFAVSYLLFDDANKMTVLGLNNRVPSAKATSITEACRQKWLCYVLQADDKQTYVSVTHTIILIGYDSMLESLRRALGRLRLLLPAKDRPVPVTASRKSRVASALSFLSSNAAASML